MKCNLHFGEEKYRPGIEPTLTLSKRFEVKQAADCKTVAGLIYSMMIKNSQMLCHPDLLGEGPVNHNILMNIL